MPHHGIAVRTAQESLNVVRAWSTAIRSAHPPALQILLGVLLNSSRNGVLETLTTKSDILTKVPLPSSGLILNSGPIGHWPTRLARGR
jgi:hypothetical protein